MSRGGRLEVDADCRDQLGREALAAPFLTLLLKFYWSRADLSATSDKGPARQRGRPTRLRFDLWVGKVSRRREQQPTPVFSPGESPGQRSLAGYRPWGAKGGTGLKRRGARGLTYNVVSVSGVQQGEQSHTHTYPLFCRFCSPTGRYRAWSRAPVCAVR